MAIVGLLMACQRVPDAGICPEEEEPDADRLWSHLEAFQAAADDNEGTRAAGTPGYDASADYVEATLDDLGYSVRRETFEFDRFVEHSTPTFEQTLPDPTAYLPDEEFGTAVFSGSGDVNAPASAVDISLGPGNESTSGCEAEDFDAFTAGDIAVIQRGVCSFGQKAQMAEAGGASAAIIFNQGDTADREDLVIGTLGAGSGVGIPVVFATYAVGEALASADESDELELQIIVDAEAVIDVTDNVLADFPSGDPGNLIVLGAHLDSVPAGPGLQDNGSGSAVLIETAEVMSRCTPTNRLRFAWWGAEELGLVGSRHHVSQLDEDEIASVAAYLNFDMIASPNYVHFVYDGNQTSFESVAVTTSGFIEQLLREPLERDGIEAKDTALNGRSDYQAFMDAGIPVGGLFTGAEQAKSPSEEEVFGGTADEAYDPCYHQACDTIDNVAVNALEPNAQAAVHAARSLSADVSTLGR
jgi:Zn-dependent M28 family amino/carboxypeptidase